MDRVYALSINIITSICVVAADPYGNVYSESIELK